MSENSNPAISPAFLEALVCPFGQAPLELNGDLLICTSCKASFRINDGVPEMMRETVILPEGMESPDALPCQSGDA